MTGLYSYRPDLKMFAKSGGVDSRDRKVENYIRDSSEDISKMVMYMLQERATREIEERSVGKFEDPYLKGTQKIGKGVVENYISRSVEDIAEQEETDLYRKHC